MAIKRAKYWNNHNVFHFESDDRQILILDKNSNTIGTLREMLFTGKTINGGNFRDIKHSGVYRIKGLQGMPDNIPSDKECILAVTAIGDADNPDMILYRLISPNGIITENTVSGSQASGWMSGGVGLQNTIKNINGSLGDLSRLKTQAKNITDALNEVNGRSLANEDNLQKLTQQFNTHNHDDRYVDQDGDAMSGDLGMANNHHYQVFNTGGSRANFGYMNNHDELVIGDSRYSTKLTGKDLTFNGSSVLTANNFEGMKLSAHKLDGIDSNGFIQVNKDDTKNGTLSFTANHHIEFDVNGRDNRIIHLHNGGDQIGSIYVNSQGTMEYRANGSVMAADMHERRFVLKHTMGIDLQDHINDPYEPRITWRRLDDNDAPMDAGIWLCQPAKWGGWSDDEKKHTVVWWNGRTNQGIAQYGYGKNGETVRIFHSPYIGEHSRRFFLQDEAPTGDIPVGSVWIGI